MTIVSVEELQDYFRTEIPADGEFVQRALNAADSAIQEYCKRQFIVADVDATARNYGTATKDVIRIHDCVAIDDVDDNGTSLVAGTSYVAEPVQNISWAGEVTPYQQIRRISGWWGQSWPTPPAVTVTARWGWAAIPPAVSQAALITAKELLDMRDVRFGIATVNDFGPLRVRVNPAVERLLAPYRRAECWNLA